MAPAAIAFWRETSIAVILVLTTVSICTCGDVDLEYHADTDVATPTVPEILSQHKSGLIENNTIEEKNSTTDKTPHKSNKYSSAKDEDPDEKNEKDHPSYGHVDNNIKKFPPKWKHPQKMFSKEMKPAGSSVRFKCAVEGNPTPNITWQKNGGPVVRSYFQPSYGKWAMGLDELTKTDDGNYTCIACNVMGCINHTIILNVPERIYAKPVLKRGGDNLTVLVGETAQFSCEFLSDMYPYVYWMFFSKGEKIYGDDSEDEITNFRQDKSIKTIMSDNSTDKPEQLTLYNVTKEKEGWYVCEAINGLGSSTAKGYLTVLESLPEKESFDHGKQTLLIIILTAVLGAMFFVAAIIVVKKLKRKKIKKQLAKETARAVVA